MTPLTPSATEPGSARARPFGKRVTRLLLRNGAQGLLARKSSLRWWLIYGPARCGTTFMMLAVTENSRVQVSDWVLAPALQLPPELPQSKFDRKRARKDVSANILANARLGGGGPLDLAFKQAWLDTEEYEALVEMWGEPERKIFCFREPSGYMASAIKKFDFLPLELLQTRYNESLDLFWELGGDAFEYTPDLTVADYRDFLAPLVIPDREPFRFRYSGSSADELITPTMTKGYNDFVARLRETSPGRSRYSGTPAHG